MEKRTSIERERPSGVGWGWGQETGKKRLKVRSRPGEEAMHLTWE